jgi:two-component system phosphate regulon response regulator PhoB
MRSPAELPMTTVLLVEDAQEITDVVTTLLTDEGFEVAACERAEDALSRIADALPDLLILDGRLPGMSGWQCLHLLRGADLSVRLPVVMLTAAIHELQSFALPLDDCTAYLTKPFNVDELLDAIQSILQTCNREPQPV